MYIYWYVTYYSSPAFFFWNNGGWRSPIWCLCRSDHLTETFRRIFMKRYLKYIISTYLLCEIMPDRYNIIPPHDTTQENIWAIMANRFGLVKKHLFSGWSIYLSDDLFFYGTLRFHCCSPNAIYCQKMRPQMVISFVSIMENFVCVRKLISTVSDHGGVTGVDKNKQRIVFFLFRLEDRLTSFDSYFNLR